ncbi:Plasmid stabilization system [Crenothrix polyspora]|uniref:Plasmid stabilization system n=1 Tax=Crenothrix polyspora TaxID=360316 RepID=A0A1R4HHK9_9GAMM|nr:type II toxin-antitoxin system RelE/ParE family toxin [Crenothrix polyspora]SJM95703.1 Plasmid stabilization system [Crenothrix polyspora]
MNVKISKRFAKDTQKITDQRMLVKIRQTLVEAGAANSLMALSNLTELSGYPGFYRIKFDYRYRIGIYVDGDTIEFLRVGNREDFYKKFP